ncbi:zinc ribbon domain-containing protein [Adlercreutzia shanghongiae]|uniref:Zinc ribbon domain-containing protein n=1 Tax=Adlercreutzia shanghongiae TaxID=3111773 RepID=A0ABU6J1G3_9ACTN|nr:zinc ribbon domain-containing protein [Adlercreutzia sp. R22]MEC4295853.1 zinc ribbon domain-containing protein [Adlercreutzia sp. R22]
MCFRPAEIQMKTCPSCGAQARPIDTVCPQCGTELEEQKVDFDADQAKLDSAIKAPAAPAAPAAPGAPKPPAAPSAPKPPRA